MLHYVCWMSKGQADAHKMIYNNIIKQEQVRAGRLSASSEILLPPGGRKLINTVLNYIGLKPNSNILTTGDQKNSKTNRKQQRLDIL